MKVAALILPTLLYAVLPPMLLAQFSREISLHLSGGASLGAPANFYRGWIEARASGLPADAQRGDPRISRTLYGERMNWSREAWSRVALVNQGGHFVALRGRLGAAESRASFSGGNAAPQELDRDLSWSALDVLAGATLGARSALRGTFYLGQSWTSWDLATGDRGRDALGHPGQPLPPDTARPIAWSDRSVRGSAFVVGGEVGYRFADALTLSLALEHRTGRSFADALQEADQRDLARAGRSVTVKYDSHHAQLPALTLSLQWRLKRFVRPDPGPRAIAAVRASGERADSTPYATPALRELLARGDTAGVIQQLEESLATGRRDASTIGMLGLLIALRAPTRETDMIERQRAEALLEEALRLDPNNPRYLAGIGITYEKRGLTNDAQRVFGRALAAAASKPDRITAEELAEIFYRRGNTLFEHVAEFDGLRNPGVQPLPINTPDCAGGGAFCLNWTRPRYFFDIFAALTDLSSLVALQRQAMRIEYERAAQLIPAHGGANRKLLGMDAWTGDWPHFRALAERYAAAAPADPWARIFLATGLLKTDDRARAVALFREAFASLGSEDRAIFEDLRPFLARRQLSAYQGLNPAEQGAARDLYWRRRDPLYLTELNETELEHWARVALAELLFGEAQTGRRGWETDRGEILARYGSPKTYWQIARDDAAIHNASREAEDVSAALGASKPGIGGRWIFWNYDPDFPSFVFEKKLGASGVRHMAESMSLFAAQDLRATTPASYDPPYRDAGAFTFQLARFRTPGADDYQLEVYAQAPPGLAADPADSIQQGFFLFQTREHRPVARVRDREEFGDGRINFTIRNVPPGVYTYALEALARDGQSATAVRGEIAVGTYSPSPVSLSDLLLAESVRPRRATPRGHEDLDSEPLRCLRVPEDRRVVVVFEAYGLQERDGLARYRVELRTDRPPAETFAVRLLRGAQQLIRPGAAGTVTFDREAAWTPDRQLDWFEVQLPPGDNDVRLSLTVTDLHGGDAGTATRTLRVEGCG